MKSTVKRSLALVLVALMLLTGMSMAAFNVSAATAPKEGMTFSSEAFYQLTNKLNVPNSITFETTLWIPCDTKDTDRNGVVIGNYSDDPAYGGSTNTYGLEMYTNGNVRLYTQAYSYVFTQVDIRDYVGTSSAPEFVDIAVVADTAAHTATLYVNGVAMQTITNSRIKSGLFNSAELSLCLGTDRRIGNSKYFNGKIKDIAVYGDVRTAEEIAAASAEGYTIDTADTNLLAAFDLTSETPFTDLSANKNDAIYYPLGGASFAASDAKQYLETKLTEKVHTYTAKIYCPVNISRTGVILGNYQNNNGEQPCLNFEIHSNGTPSLYIKDSNGVAKPKFNGSDADGNRLSDVRRNGWVHLVIVDTGSEFRCYIDGVFTEAVSYSAANVKAGYTYDIAKVQSVNQLSVGRDTRDNLVFTGKIDHIAYYSEVLTDSEIAKLYKNGVDTDEESLMFYYDLSDGNNSPVIEDKSDNKNNASPLYYARPTHKTDFAYSIAVVGDTQKQVWRDFLTANDSDPNNDTHYTDAIYQWLVDNKDSKNIQYVFGVGDITENNGNPSKNSNDLEWEIAKNAITKLDAAGMAYSVILGNHDTAAQFNKFFADPTDDFYTSRIDGYYVEGDLSNYYVKFEINGIKYLHIGLEYGPRDAVLEWAGQVADDNPERIVIVTTHAYMFRDGTTLDKGDVVPPNSSGVITSASSRNNGDMMWEKFASQHRNILLVLSGHDPYENIAFRQDKGIYGNTVSQFLVDPQGMSVDLGMVCMLYFDEDGRQVDVEWISTAKTQAAQKNNPDATDILYKSFNQFDFELYSYAGNGIHSTELVSRDGNIDTYRIYYTNGTYTEYTVENGLAITVTDVKKETDGLIDTYTIYFSDGSSTSYTVKNGEDGKDGADGKTPYIGENGNWWIGITDTGVSASGGAATEPDYGNEITSGTCGATLNWFVTDKNILVISGKGSMTNYRAGETPWINYAGDITEVVVKEGVTTIGKNAFNGLTKLNSVKLPVSLLSIEGYAFYGCAALDSVNIPANVRFIGAFAFRKSGLSSLGLRAPEAWSIKGINETPDKMELNGVAAAYIKNKYYTYDWYVADVSVGEVIANGICGDNVYWTLTSDGTLTVLGEGNMGDYRSTTMPWYNYIGSIFNVVIEDGVTNVGRYAFAGADKLQSVNIPEGVDSIGAFAFYGTSRLEEVTIPATVKNIGANAFAKSGLFAVYFCGSADWYAGTVRVDDTDPIAVAVLLKNTFASSTWVVSDVYTIRESYMPELVYADLKRIFENREATFAAYSYSNAPFAIRDVYSISDCRVLSISVPVMKTLSADENGNFYFTIFVANNSLDTMASATRRTYRIAINAEQYGLTSNNAETYKWIKIDLAEYGIELAADETLAFGEATDTVIPAYLGNGSNSNSALSLLRQEFPELSGFYTRVGRGDSVKTNLGFLMFDFEIERSYASKAEYDAVEAEKAEYLAKLDAVKEEYAGKKLSILGDSISTFDGYSNNTDYNSTIGGNAIWYPNNNTNFYDYSYTYWGRLINDLGMELCVNNSWSGSRVYNSAPNRALELDNDNGTAGDPTDDIAPDVIFFYMGINDIRKGSEFGDLYAILTDTASTLTAEERIAAWLTTFDANNYTTFDQAYALSIMNMKAKYPEAEIWCSTLLYNNEDLFNEELFIGYNYCIKALAEYFGCNVADQQNGYITEENCHAYGSDISSLHPSPYGHELMEKFIVEAFYDAMTNDA